jgi:hypothetical protein
MLLLRHRPLSDNAPGNVPAQNQGLERLLKKSALSKGMGNGLPVPQVPYLQAGFSRRGTFFAVGATFFAACSAAVRLLQNPWTKRFSLSDGITQTISIDHPIEPQDGLIV